MQLYYTGTECGSGIVGRLAKGLFGIDSGPPAKSPLNGGNG